MAGVERPTGGLTSSSGVPRPSGGGTSRTISPLLKRILCLHTKTPADAPIFPCYAAGPVSWLVRQAIACTYSARTLTLTLVEPLLIFWPQPQNPHRKPLEADHYCSKSQVQIQPVIVSSRPTARL